MNFRRKSRGLGVVTPPLVGAGSARPPWRESEKAALPQDSGYQAGLPHPTPKARTHWICSPKEEEILAQPFI